MYALVQDPLAFTSLTPHTVNLLVTETKTVVSSLHVWLLQTGWEVRSFWERCVSWRPCDYACCCCRVIGCFETSYYLLVSKFCVIKCWNQIHYSCILDSVFQVAIWLSPVQIEIMKIWNCFFLLGQIHGNHLCLLLFLEIEEKIKIAVIPTAFLLSVQWYSSPTSSA